jgi:hypothetical protein
VYHNLRSRASVQRQQENVALWSIKVPRQIEREPLPIGTDEHF